MSGLRIFLVEDEILIAEDARIRLEGMGYQVIGTAASGPEAVQQAGELRPDLILMDVRLQGAMNGVEAARRIRRRADVPHHLCHGPRRYVTAHAAVLASSENGERCTCLEKPYPPSQLQAAIQAVLVGRNTPRSERKCPSFHKWVAKGVATIHRKEAISPRLKFPLSHLAVAVRVR
jgi:CheY-like chemotaxis protein